jgi:hypothetical protein
MDHAVTDGIHGTRLADRFRNFALVLSVTVLPARFPLVLNRFSLSVQHSPFEAARSRVQNEDQRHR